MSTVINPNPGGGGGSANHVEVDFNIAASSASEATLIELQSLGIIYILKDLDIKSDNPGSDTITLRLYKNVNGSLTQVDSFVLNSSNYNDPHSIMDQFARDDVVSAHIKVTAQTSAGTYNVTGSASYSEET